MPTFDDPAAGAAEAAEALRGLAHATRTVADPADMYPVIGELLSGLRSLRQVAGQLAAAHTGHRHRAFDDSGDHTAGTEAAAGAAAELIAAAALLDRAHDRMNTAFTHTGTVAWHPQPAAGITERPQRWISVVFLQGDDADPVLDLIDNDGTDAAIDHLTGYDMGEETVDAALENGYVYDTPPAGDTDRTAASGAYLLNYNPRLGYVGLLRAWSSPPDPDLPAPAAAKAGPGRSSPAGQDAGWFAQPPAAGQSRGGVRGRAL